MTNHRNCAAGFFKSYLKKPALVVKYVFRSTNPLQGRHNPMFKRLEHTLESFRDCFTRKPAFKWFVVIVVGFLLRSDHLGITSVIRDLALDGRNYENLRHFFYSTAWSLDQLRRRWYTVVRDSGLVYTVNGKSVLAGDGVKQAKEAKYMPGVKKLAQESENSSKPEFIFGHMFGAIGVILGKAQLCCPLRFSIQEGLKSLSEWNDSFVSGESHVVQITNNLFDAARTFGKSYGLLDRLFLCAPVLIRLKELNDAYNSEEHLLEIVTKAKSNCVAYRKPDIPEKREKGRPRLKGDSVHIKDLWNDGKQFISATAFVYGKQETVEYRCIDLLWGKGIYQELRFVLVRLNGTKSILVSTDLSLPPVQIIELYARRFKIENCFREFKQQFGGFCYHFWTKTLPKLNRFKKKGAPDPVDTVTDEHDRRIILGKIRAIEGFVLIANIAMGITQILSLTDFSSAEVTKGRYLRTSVTARISEATIMCYLRKNLFALLLQHPDSPITHFIRERQTALFEDLRSA